MVTTGQFTPQHPPVASLDYASLTVSKKINLYCIFSYNKFINLFFLNYLTSQYFDTNTVECCEVCELLFL